MQEPKKDADWYDRIETIAKLAGYVGMNEIRVRWKLRAWYDNSIKARREMKSRAAQVVRKHKTCPKCNAINSVEDAVCHKCGAKLPSWSTEVVSRFFRRFDLGFSSEMFLAVALVFVYGIEIYRSGAQYFLHAHIYDLVAMGGISPLDTGRSDYIAPDLFTLLGSRWYTLLTCVFLHGGLLHLLFNTYAVMYIAPAARKIFNSGKVMLVFIASGVAASFVSLYWRMNVLHEVAFVGIGASGAICGLIGLMTVWGQLDGTFSGVGIRNQMARWVFYILLYGYFLGADNAAHIGGLVAGGAFAVLLPTDFQRPESRSWTWVGIAMWLAVVAAVGLIAFLALTVPHMPTFPE